MYSKRLKKILHDVASCYPEDLRADQVLDIPRIQFNIDLVLQAARPKHPGELEICDLGGGIGLFSVGAAAYGVKRSVLVDDFRDPINDEIGHGILDLHKSFGVEVVSRDLIDMGILDIPGSFDVITSFGAMEHWHHSPKKMFHEVVAKLKPGGAFILGTPNCVNIRKRITVPFGIGKWSQMQDWYELDRFRGHVREPDVQDLTYIARDMRLENIKILGRNWLGIIHKESIVRIFAKSFDYFLRLHPPFCSDIYLVGLRRAQGAESPSALYTSLEERV